MTPKLEKKAKKAPKTTTQALHPPSGMSGTSSEGTVGVTGTGGARIAFSSLISSLTGEQDLGLSSGEAGKDGWIWMPSSKSVFERIMVN